MADVRQNETPQQTQDRHDVNAQHMADVRQNETPQQTHDRLDAQRQRQAIARAHEYLEERRRRLIGNLQRLPRTHNIARTPPDPFEPIQPFAAGQMDVICEHCESKSFPREKYNCCHNGKVSLDEYPFPRELQELYTSDSDLAKNFRKNTRRINTAFAFASHQAKLDTPPGRGPPVFRLHGQIYHSYAALHPNNPNNPPSFNQLYIYQPSEANNYRLLNHVTGGCHPEVLEIIANILHLHNPFARGYRTMHEVELREKDRAAAEGIPVPTVTMQIRSGPDRRRYNAPLQDEVAAIFTSFDGAADIPHDIVVYTHSNKLKSISYLSPNCDPMCYPILYPSGEAGWSIDLRHVEENATAKRNSLTILQYYAYRWADRGRFNPLHYAGYLSQQKIIDDWLKVESSRLDYIKKQQSRLRVETLHGLYDHVHNHNRHNNVANSNSPPPSPLPAGPPVPPSVAPFPAQAQSNNIIDPPGSPLPFDPDDFEPQYDAGTEVILPSSFMGSPRNMTEAYHDAMTVVTTLGPPDLFITFTCNENWPAIRNNLKPGQTPSDRPDLMARVFELYHAELIRDLTERHVLGRCISKINVIEFQKRGKPHSHILIHLEDNDKIRSASDIDSIVSAEIPDPLLFPELHNIVTSCMLHGPCGDTWDIAEAVCMKNGVCTKEFPKKVSQHTIFSENGYPVYRRRDDGRVFTKNGKPLNNLWVVPYNIFLLLKYRCHINVEICVSIKSIKYVFKYVYKGHDCASIQFKRDTIESYLDARYICAPEAAHRLFEFKMRHSTFSVDRLPVHLPDMQCVYFKPGEEDDALESALQKDSKLTAFFDLNSSDPFARQFLYSDIPLYYWWSDNQWKRRKRNQKTLTRLYHVSPRDTERFHLKLLLLNYPGPTGFDDLLTNNGVISSSFQESCKERRLIQDDSMWTDTIEEAVNARMPYQLREMFSSMLLNCDISNPRGLWNQFRISFIEDHTNLGDSVVVAVQKALAHIESVLQNSSKTLADYRLPVVDPSVITSDDPPLDPWFHVDMEQTLTEEQRDIWDEIVNPDRNRDPDGPKVFFVDGPGGSGKTYLYTFMIHWHKFFNQKVMPSAMTGIAAILLPGGQTTHKTFCIPIPCLDNSTCRISPSSEYAELLRQVFLFIIDEASMLSRYQFEAIDRVMRDITGKDVPFGGKIFVLGGDFRQTLPVVRRGSDTVIIENSIISSPLWSIVKRFRLTTNMRANPEEEEFKSFLLDMGDGNLPLKNTPPFAESIEIPYNYITSQNIVDDIFPQDQISQDPASLIKRAILCPTNKEATSINATVLDRLPGEVRMYPSVDSVEGVQDEDEAENYTVEFLNSLTPSGMPHHNIFLKEGAIAMLLRNINTSKGMTNGVRIIIRHMYNLFLDVELLTGQSEGKRVFIPKMNLIPSDTDLPFRLRRLQFPIRLAYAMTINKSQGQTFDKVGIYLNRACFSHGQLYVAFSRARSHKDISVKIVETPEQGKHRAYHYTKNVVLRQVLRS